MAVSLGRRALLRAAKCAEERDARVVVVGVETANVGAARSGGPRNPLDRWPDPEAEHALMRRIFWGKASEWEVVHARGTTPEKAIVALAADREAELVVVGAGTPTILKRLLRQAVSENVIAFAPCDVYVVR